MHLDAPMPDSGDDDEGDEDAGEEMDTDVAPIPMPESGGIVALREKLHARMAQLRNRGRGGGWEANSRDDLLEERRQQRAAMRERRRKETKEKIRQQEERRGKGKEKEKGKEKQQQQQKGPQTKVRTHPWLLDAFVSIHAIIYFLDTVARTRHRQTRTL